MLCLQRSAARATLAWDFLHFIATCSTALQVLPRLGMKVWPYRKRATMKGIREGLEVRLHLLQWDVESWRHIIAGPASVHPRVAEGEAERGSAGLRGCRLRGVPSPSLGTGPPSEGGCQERLEVGGCKQVGMCFLKAATEAPACMFVGSIFAWPTCNLLQLAGAPGGPLPVVEP